jgi:dynein heavy chain
MKPSEIAIDTIETTRQEYFLNRFISNDKHVLMIGPSGTGKTYILNKHLYKLSKNKYHINRLIFSTKTNVQQTQDVILSKVNR